MRGIIRHRTINDLFICTDNTGIQQLISTLFFLGYVLLDLSNTNTSSSKNNFRLLTITTVIRTVNTTIPYDDTSIVHVQPILSTAHRTRDRTGQEGTWQDRTGHRRVRTGQDRAGQDRVEQGHGKAARLEQLTGQGITGQDRTGPGQDRTNNVYQ